jgi:hypothetical protein
MSRASVNPMMINWVGPAIGDYRYAIKPGAGTASRAI